MELHEIVIATIGTPIILWWAVKGIWWHIDRTKYKQAFKEIESYLKAEILVGETEISINAVLNKLYEIKLVKGKVKVFENEKTELSGTEIKSYGEKPLIQDDEKILNVALYGSSMEK